MFKTSIILASLFVLINSYCVFETEEELMNAGKVRDFDDCNARTSNYELEQEGKYACCHISFDLDTKNVYKEVDTCIFVTQSEYDNIKRFVDEYESYYGVEHVKIHCLATSLKFSLLILLFLLI